MILGNTRGIARRASPTRDSPTRTRDERVRDGLARARDAFVTAVRARACVKARGQNDYSWEPTDADARARG